MEIVRIDVGLVTVPLARAFATADSAHVAGLLPTLETAEVAAAGLRVVIGQGFGVW